MKSLGSIVATAARTACGLDAEQSAFALRTGLPALRPSPLAAPDGEPVVMGFDPTLDPYLVGAERAAALARVALHELAAKILPTTLRSLKLRVAIGAPEPLPGDSAAAAARTFGLTLKSALVELLGDVPVDVSASGAAGLAYALPDALGELARGAVDAVVAGGVHTDYDPATIGALEAQGRLFSPAQIDAVIPGEGAAFVLITKDDFARRANLPVLARILGCGTEEGGPTAIGEGSSFDARATASAIRKATRPLTDELKVGWMIGDLGVEQYRVRELYAALVRVHTVAGPPFVVESPAQRVGHLGAAAIPLAMVLAAFGFDRGFAPSPFALAVGGSDAGDRGAVLVSAP